MSSFDVSIYESFLSDFDRVDFSKLRSIATLHTLPPGTVLFEQGEMNSYVSFVVTGAFECLVDGQRTYSLNPGNFIAEAGLHAGSMYKGGVKTSGTVKAREKCTILSFKRSELVEVREG